ncbi:MAG: hypothetical protein H2038_00655 [Brevundimonas sp.]|uniref:hypothetical protein n=1 Tax=Brevundimonas sp. TaxID=1871086 RepID=UPI001796E400|nr:hypothetical protein [Brevundimonas sp.]MBA4803144.1 hypothetical protein [Brevundimonas sp.]
MIERLLVGGLGLAAMGFAIWYVWAALRTGVAGSELGGRIYRTYRRSQPVGFFTSVALMGFCGLALGGFLGLIALGRLDLFFG